MRHKVVVMMVAMEKTRMTKKTLLAIGECGGMQYDRTSNSPSEDHRLISVCFVTWRKFCSTIFALGRTLVLGL